MSDCTVISDRIYSDHGRVYYQGKRIAEHQATDLREPIRALKRSKTRAKAASSYSWVYAASASPYSP